MKRAAFILLGVALVACEPAAKNEAATLVSAVDRFRRAGNAEKPAIADSLHSIQCTDPEVCHARDACLASADATAAALRTKSEVERGLAALERGELSKESPEAQALPGKLDVAEGLLKQGHERLTPCEEATTALKRKYRL